MENSLSSTPPLERLLKCRLDEIEERIHLSLEKVHRKRTSLLLLPATKGQGVETIKALYALGFRSFGENRMQEALLKISTLPRDIHWHFIGSLQKNKIQHALDHFAMIQSIDTKELAEKLSKKALEKNKVISLLLEVNASLEESKHGFLEDTLLEHFETLWKLPNLKIQGLMTLGPKDENEKNKRRCFASLRRLLERLNHKLDDEKKLKELSMGMSDDFELAIEEGSTMVRLGRALFETRT